MPNDLRRRVLVGTATAALAAPAVLAACGGGPDPRSVVVSSASRTTVGRTSRLALYFSSPQARGADRRANAAPVAEGAFDFGRRRGHFVVDLGGVGLGPPSSKAEIRMDGTVMYVLLPPGLPVAAVAGRPWLRIDLATPAAAEEVMAAQLQSASGEPAAVVDLLRGAEGPVRRLGDDRVRGVRTMHYRATVDMARALARVPTARRPDLDRFAAAMPRRRLPVDVWVDVQGRARRITYARPRLTLTIELFDFGVGVDVGPPPAQQVTEMGTPTR